MTILSDYRDIICENFLQRKRTNARYSLRAFARDINISVSHLSEVLSGKSEISRLKGENIAAALKMPPMQREDFLDLIDAQTAQQEIQREAALARIRKRQTNLNRRDMSIDEFVTIADPRYLLAWSLMQIPSFNGESATLQKHLKLNAVEVFEILQRLARLGLVQRRDRLWAAIDCQFTAGDKVPSEALRAFHRSMALLGRKSIDHQTIKERHLDSLVMPFDSQRIGEVQQRIANFTQSLIDEFGYGGDTVYGMTLQFFRMTEPMQGAISKKSPPNQEAFDR